MRSSSHEDGRITARSGDPRDQVVNFKGKGNFAGRLLNARQLGLKYVILPGFTFLQVSRNAEAVLKNQKGLEDVAAFTGRVTVTHAS